MSEELSLILGYKPEVNDDNMQSKGAKESLIVSRNFFSLHDLWQNVHLANFNTKYLPVDQRKNEQIKKVGQYPARLNECSFATLGYHLSDMGDIMIKIDFPKTGRSFQYNPIESVTLKRAYLDEIEEANEEEGDLILKLKRENRKRHNHSRSQTNGKREEQYDSRSQTNGKREEQYDSRSQTNGKREEQYDSRSQTNEGTMSIEERVEIKNEIDNLREKIIRELSS